MWAAPSGTLLAVTPVVMKRAAGAGPSHTHHKEEPLPEDGEEGSHPPPPPSASMAAAAGPGPSAAPSTRRRRQQRDASAIKAAAASHAGLSVAPLQATASKRPARRRWGAAPVAPAADPSLPAQPPALAPAPSPYKSLAERLREFESKGLCSEHHEHDAAASGHAAALGGGSRGAIGPPARGAGAHKLGGSGTLLGAHLPVERPVPTITVAKVCGICKRES